jgi:hypothetical protein
LKKQAERNAKEEAELQHLAFRRDVQSKAQRRRAVQSLPQRLAVALAHAHALSDVRAASLDRVTHGRPASTPPSPINGLLHGPSQESVGDIYERRIRILIEGLEREVDAHRLGVLGQVGSNSEDAGQIEFRIISDYEGETPRMVSFLEVSLQHMKKPEKYIMSIREKNGCDPIYGRKES